MMSGEHPPLFQLRLMEKDVRHHARVGRGSPVVTSAAHQAYATAVEDGFGDSNWTAVYESMKAK
jgi:3-hydroxyisobutyrate dehydrogenase-like beta-hydroxyacid dehydrogenase